MKFEDLSMTLEQVVDFVKNHNMPYDNQQRCQTL